MNPATDVSFLPNQPTPEYLSALYQVIDDSAEGSDVRFQEVSQVNVHQFTTVTMSDDDDFMQDSDQEQ